MSGKKRVLDEEKHLLFNDLPRLYQEILKDLSIEGYIYLGRTGAGLSYAFRRLCFTRGTLKAIEEEGPSLDPVKKRILETVAIEGPKWVPYERLEEVIMVVVGRVGKSYQPDK